MRGVGAFHVSRLASGILALTRGAWCLMTHFRFHERRRKLLMQPGAKAKSARTVSQGSLLEVLGLGPVARLVPHVHGEVVRRVGIQPDHQTLARLTVDRISP